MTPRALVPHRAPACPGSGVHHRALVPRQGARGTGHGPGVHLRDATVPLLDKPRANGGALTPWTVPQLDRGAAPTDRRQGGLHSVARGPAGEQGPARDVRAPSPDQRSVEGRCSASARSRGSRSVVRGIPCFRSWAAQGTADTCCASRGAAGHLRRPQTHRATRRGCRARYAPLVAPTHSAAGTPAGAANAAAAAPTQGGTA